MASPLLKSHPWKLAAAFGALLVSLSLVSCGEDTSARRQRAALVSTGADDVYLRSVSATLNDLAGHIDLELQPAQPILTASTSADGKEVRAACIENPNNPDGQFSYLLVTTGNAKFASVGVQPGDRVRYYVNLDEETAERGIEQRSALELLVRRLDSRDPENALILDPGLNAPVVNPQRIEIWRYADKRMDAIRSALQRYVQRRLPPVGWEPTPDAAAMQQIVERANQWLRDQPRSKDWKREPLLTELEASLPPAETDAGKRARQVLTTQISSEGLRDAGFSDWEARVLAESVWMRDISQWARGTAGSDLDVATALFDWTVRNIQLDPADSDPSRTINHPWQAAMYGHGNALHRAWVFAELCRQQRIDAVVLHAGGSEKDAGGRWLVGIAVDEKLYLFDPELGLPLPGKESLAGTLAELSADDVLLRKLDIEGKATYPLKADQLKEVEAFVVATPTQLAERSRLLEAGLKGEDFTKLAVEVHPLVERLGKQSQIKSVKLWPLPFEAILNEHTLPQTSDEPLRQLAAADFAPLAERPLLWKARVLHFQGNKEVRADERDDPLARPRQGHQDAVKLYHNDQVRPSDAELAKLEPDVRAVRGAGKAAAGYWLGLLSYDRGNYEVALDWLGPRTLEHDRQGRWAPGARYNLARTYEAMGNVEEAIRLLESDPDDAPQRLGNLVRANRLREAQAEAKPAAEPNTESAPQPATEPK